MDELDEGVWDLAEWLKRLTANAKVAIVDPSILRHSGIWGAADEPVLNKGHKKIQKIPLQKNVFKFYGVWKSMRQDIQFL